MTGQDILNQFHNYTGDQSELSTEDELILLNNIYDSILSDRPWEFLKTSTSGSILSDGTVSYITLPEDFRFFIENNQKTDNSQTTYNNASQKVIFVGPNYTPYQIVNWSDRRQFQNTSGYAYPDLANNRIVFTVPPADSTYEFDYIKNWSPVTLVTSPIFPSDFHNMIHQYMAVDSVIINLFDRAHSYAKENQTGADELFKAMCYWNSMLTFN
jgi:hypothetical protein